MTKATVGNTSSKGKVFEAHWYQNGKSQWMGRLFFTLPLSLMFVWCILGKLITDVTSYESVQAEMDVFRADDNQKGIEIQRI